MPSLVEKLAEVAKSIPQLQKAGDNGEYQFLTALQVFDAVRSKLFAQGVVIIPRAVRELHRSQPYLTVTEDVTDEAMFVQQYEITDGVQSICAEVPAVGQDREGKAAYIALTGAMKALLKQLLLLAGIEDDPENSTDTKVAPALQDMLDAAVEKFGPDLSRHPCSRRMVIAFRQMCKLNSIPEKVINEYLVADFGVRVPSQLKRGQIDVALEWAKNYGKNSSGTEPEAD